MLSDQLKTDIQAYYNQLLDRQGFKQRYCQKLMIADIANLLANREEVEERDDDSDGHIAVIEAGTGTGKTIAYLLSCLPLARAEGKKLVIATATVALQEQIIFKDLPDVLKHLPELDFSFALAKGRRRYACLSQMDRVLKEGDAFNLSLALYDDEIASEELETDQRDTCVQMIEAIGRGEWDGDRDRWERELDEGLWSRISVDHGRCSGRACSYYDNCCFYKARESVYRADCIVANHDLVISDLMMGGGLVLPAPEESIYVFDEAHHLPDKAINHLSHFTRLNATQSWLEQLPDNIAAMSKLLGDVDSSLRDIEKYEPKVIKITELLQLLSRGLDEFLATREVDIQKSTEGGEEKKTSRYRFPMGDCTPEFREHAAILHQEFAQLTQWLSEIVDVLQQNMTDADPDFKDVYESWYPVMASHLGRAEGNSLLWHDYLREDSPDNPPQARWVNIFDEMSGVDIQLNASPVSIDKELRELIWDRAWAVVLTSATLAVHSDFFLYAKKTGLREDAHYRVLPSPFNYPEQGVLQVPKMTVDPRNPDEHSESIAELLPVILKKDLASLVLFSSWRQMRRVEELIDEEFGERIIMQGELGKAQMLSEHKKRIDAGETSVIFGLASFAEGIDLPGKYCTHVVIAKIPFSVPDDPVTATYSEWLESRGSNAFVEVSIPDAILKLNQACGRLIRTETDKGTVTIMDRRLVTQRYGKKIMDSLPAFRRQS